MVTPIEIAQKQAPAGLRSAMSRVSVRQINPSSFSPQMGPFRALYHTWESVLENAHTEVDTSKPFIVKVTPAGDALSDQQQALLTIRNYSNWFNSPSSRCTTALHEDQDGSFVLYVVPANGSEDVAKRHLRKFWMRLWE